jgi:rod shape-determining protein MreC
VILATDLNSRIPVAIQPGDAQAMMAGDNSRAPLLELKSQNAKLKPGDQIVTSGDGGLLPNGLPVGTVVWDGQNFRVALLADSNTSEDVRILDLKNPPETPPAPSASDLPAVAAGMAPMLSVPPIKQQPAAPTAQPPAATTKPAPAPAQQTAAPAKPSQPDSTDDAADER